MDDKGFTPNAGRWTSEEHEKFLEGLEAYGKEWKKIADLIKTRTVVQIRTHAQKYFQKLAKTTGGPVMSTSKKEDVVRPPAKKRKSEHNSRHSTSSHRKPNNITVPPQRSIQRSRRPSRTTVEEKDSGGGGATPRTVAAATILLRPRLQQKLQSGGDTPKTRQTAAWLAKNQAQAAAVLAKRRKSKHDLNSSNHSIPPSNLSWNAVTSSH